MCVGSASMCTASAVVADVIAAARKLTRAGYHPWQPNRPDAVMAVDRFASPWFVRLAKGGLEAGEKLTISEGTPEESGWITPAMTRPQLEEMLAGQDVLSVIRVLA